MKLLQFCETNNKFHKKQIGKKKYQSDIDVIAVIMYKM